MKRSLALCYNRAMRLIPYAGLAAAFVIFSGCALTSEQADTLPSGAPQIDYAQVKAAPESYNGQPVTFGGKVLGARRLKEGTRIEILQLPLTASLPPTMDLGKSQGRFVAPTERIPRPCDGESLLGAIRAPLVLLVAKRARFPYYPLPSRLSTSSILHQRSTA